MIYLIDLNTMIQTNVFTGFQRKLAKEDSTTKNKKVLDLSSVVCGSVKSFTHILSVTTHENNVKKLVADTIK